MERIVSKINAKKRVPVGSYVTIMVEAPLGVEDQFKELGINLRNTSGEVLALANADPVYRISVYMGGEFGYQAFWFRRDQFDVY